MKKTSIYPILALAIAAATALTAFSEQKSTPLDPEASFESFLQQFPAQSLPYTLDEKDLKIRLDRYVAFQNEQDQDAEYPEPKRLQWEYYSFLPDVKAEASFSRFPLLVEPVAHFAAADHFAVLYCSSRSFRFGYCSYVLAVFDKKGHQISSNTIGQVNPESILSGTISKQLTAAVKTWHINWAKDYRETGLEGNAIKGLKHVSTDYVDLMLPTEISRDPFRNDKKFIVPQQAIEPEPAIKSK